MSYKNLKQSEVSFISLEKLYILSNSGFTGGTKGHVGAFRWNVAPEKKKLNNETRKVRQVEIKKEIIN